MYGFYIIALIPAIIGMLFLVFSDKINWIEWMASVIAGLICSAIIHICAINGMVGDVETWSGKLTKAVYEPEWVEKYRQQHSETIVVGHRKDGSSITTTRTWYTTEYRTHHEQWTAYGDFGSGVTDSYSINEVRFKDISSNFGGIKIETPFKDGFYKGDKNIYVSYNNKGYVYPIITTRSFDNRLKAAPTVMSYAPVPKNVHVFEYPSNTNPFQSDRLAGLSYKHFDLSLFDQMNSRVGPKRFVNVILVEFGSNESQHIAKYQEAKWVGGKKNDLVICYSLDKNRDTQWAYCFGWSDSNLIKRNMESLFINNRVNNELLPKIEAEINKNWHKKDWHEFDYITIRPSRIYYITLIIVMFVVQIIVWGISFCNDLNRDNRGKYENRRRF
jgi:hypothetical protein